MEDGSIQLLQAADRRRRPGSTLAVTGCLAGMFEDRLREDFEAVVIPPRDYGRLDELIGAKQRIEETADPHTIEPRVVQACSNFSRLEHFALGNEATERLRRSPLVSKVKKLIPMGEKERLAEGSADEAYTVRVAWGCLGSCTYCAIRAACGPLRSKPLDKVMAEFDEGLRRGNLEFTLVAQDLGAYGQDIGTNVYELLREMFAREGGFHLNLVDLNIRWVVRYEQGLLELLSRNRDRIRTMQLPLQSGSDRILQLMQRGHSAAEAERVMKELREALPAVNLGTHALVGFPSESEQDFRDTMRILHAVGFDKVDVFAYADRPNTPAASMADKVPHAVVKQRSMQVHRAFKGRDPGVTGIVHLVREVAAGRQGRRATRAES